MTGKHHTLGKTDSLTFTFFLLRHYWIIDVALCKSMCCLPGLVPIHSRGTLIELYVTCRTDREDSPRPLSRCRELYAVNRLKTWERVCCLPYMCEEQRTKNLENMYYFPSCSGRTISLYHSFTSR